MSRSWCLCWIVAAACARGGDGSPDARTDGTSCAEQTYYRDTDGDGHGDPMASVKACEPPAGTVMSGDDCDDGNPQRHPGLTEICDALDNDCSDATPEICPTGCTPMRRPAPDNVAHAYLVCATAASWTNARDTCASAMYALVQIDDAAENAFVRTAGDTVLGTGAEFHIGGTDSVAEGVWRWDGGGPQFWQGGSGGVPVGGHYANWNSGEPNDSSGEDCAEMRSTAVWNDTDCSSDSQPFICRR